MILVNTGFKVNFLVHLKDFAGKMLEFEGPRAS